ncbi:hypothetical protein DBR11_20940 [Pedobacter sp. HMWF019]|uniref:hypothetical protein n=1 Tax=Pedobacter sp. HMWF019 TaxID=2056856 RepID=UPI000D3C98BB|nr:hypothetical protein [Pedobacter sp. HMWF019]PTS95648.1 hypothetical protein DBR11_20940 [Pedobacter sp. HMWF019]
MMSASDVAKVFDTILLTPGMLDVVKVDLKISRKNVLLLSSVISRGLNPKDESNNGLLENVPPDLAEQLTGFADECLQKAGLTELSQKLKSLNSK